MHKWSTPPPEKKTAISLTDVSRLLDTKKRMLLKKNIFTYQVFSCKGLSNDESGVARDPVLDEMRSGAGFQTGDFVGEKLGGGGGIMP